MVEIRFLVPETWRDQLQESARSQRISLADLCRIILRGFLRERYSPEQLAALGI